MNIIILHTTRFIFSRTSCNYNYSLSVSHIRKKNSSLSFFLVHRSSHFHIYVYILIFFRFQTRARARSYLVDKCLFGQLTYLKFQQPKTFMRNLNLQCQCVHVSPVFRFSFYIFPFFFNACSTTSICLGHNVQCA